MTFPLSNNVYLDNNNEIQVVENNKENKNIFSNVYKCFQHLQVYQAPINSFISCVNYTKGNFDEVIYGKFVAEKIDLMFDWMKYPDYVELFKNISSGEILHQSWHEVAMGISTFVESTFTFLTALFENLGQLLKYSEETIPGLLKLKNIVDLTGQVSAITLSISSGANTLELAQSLYNNKNERDTLNYIKLLSNATLCVMSANVLFQFFALTRATSIIYNITTVASFSFEHLFYKNKNMQIKLAH